MVCLGNARIRPFGVPWSKRMSTGGTGVSSEALGDEFEYGGDLLACHIELRFDCNQYVVDWEKKCTSDPIAVRPDRPTRLSRRARDRCFCATPLHVLSEWCTGEKYIEPAILSARVSAARVALEAARHLRNPQSIDKLFDKATPHLREARSARRACRDASRALEHRPVFGEKCLAEPVELWLID
jgi:hypothetical protein